MKYTVVLSNKVTMVLDQEDKDKLVANISAPFVQTKEGVINPAYIVAIKEDKEASREEMIDKRYEETKELPTGKMSLEQVRSFRPDFVNEVLEARKRAEENKKFSTGM